MINNLKDNLNAIWGSVIEETKFDMLKNEILFNVRLISGGLESNYNIVFKKVSSFFFINENGKLRFNFRDYEESDYLELTSINYFENGIGNIFIDNTLNSWTSQCIANANFSLEIWDTHLFIEAGIVEINGKVYHLKKLDDSTKEASYDK